MHPRVIQSPDPHWPFQAARPLLHVGGGRQPRAVPLHPAPAYPHDAALVEKHLRHLEQCFPLPRPPIVYLPRHDGEGGVGAVTFDGAPLEHEADARGQPLIILFAKPTPIHPALTRYLLAHEYGHAVADYLGRQHQGNGEPGRRLMEAEYIELRGLPHAPRVYGPGTWHQDPEEIFANDFRILVAGQEVDFWPHEVPHPTDEGSGMFAGWGGELRAWWRRVANDARTRFGSPTDGGPA